MLNLNPLTQYFMKKYNSSCLNPENQPGVIFQRSSKEFMEEMEKIDDKMTEKLFDEVSTCGFHGVKNTQTNKYYWGNKREQVGELVDLLNRQNNQIMTSNHQLRILKEDNNQLRILVETLKTENKKLKLRLKDLGVEYYD